MPQVACFALFRATSAPWLGVRVVRDGKYKIGCAGLVSEEF